MRTHYDIKLPTVPEGWVKWPEDESPTEAARRIDELVCVTTKSSKRLRRAVYDIAYLFKNELDFDFPQYGYKGQEEETSARAYLWWRSDCGYHTGLGRLAIMFGACCFRDRGDHWGLQWVWVHPYERRKGHLSRAWPYFGERFGVFVPETPFSTAMVSFLKKQRYDKVLRRSLSRKKRPK